MISETTVDKAFMLMRETADNLLLAPEAIDRERGIILSEMRSRNTLPYRELSRAGPSWRRAAV